ncbi:MAG: DUF362 domain-containing protein [Patescibacteria group bacterium]|nr:DUF362 domain-containing protein [Patescibacteria group bacterium]
MERLMKVEAGHDLKDSIREAVDMLGGFGVFLKKGETALVKPNFNTIDPPPASTDPRFLEAFVDLLHEHGASKVTIGESSTFYGNTRWNLENVGLKEMVEKRSWLDFISFDEDKWIKRKVEGGKFLKNVSVPRALGDYDRLFFVCCLKTHCHARFTGALKLTVGLMKGQQRMGLHLRNIQPKVAELASVFSPDLTIMDGRKCFITRGPSEGEVREPGVILAGTDRVAMDIEGIRVIQEFEGNDLAGIAPEELPQIARAIELDIDNHGR